MAQDNSVPMGFGGGLTRFKEEYNSKIKFSPSAVVVMVIVVILFVISLKFLFPIKVA
jgi:preprotein translocase subunit Sec61beta